MKFTYGAYRELLNLLKFSNYNIVSYDDCDNYEKCVILRHDVDNSLEKALELAKIEYEENVTSTYFIMIASPFYNIATKRATEIIKEIYNMGHTVGLHFDEVKYCESEDIVKMIKKEAKVMEMILDIPISCVSMHRPSQDTLEANYIIENMINSYSKKFFREYKYLSDSRRNWREDILKIIKSGEYNRFHILTHAFWYEKEEISIESSLKKFIQDGLKQRYINECDNIRDFEEIIPLEECYENFAK